MSDEKTYHLKYQIQPGEFRKSDLNTEVEGGTDAVILVSILRGAKPFEGEKSFAIVSMDGHTGEPVTDAEIFQVFSLVAKQLSESPALSSFGREVCAEFFEKVRQRVVARG